jgi:hypothetical protein
MHWLQRSALKSARAWRLKMALREVYAQARSHNSQAQAATDLQAWLSWARRCRLEPFKKLATTLKERFDAVVRGMVDHRSNAFVEAMNGLLQQAKRAARGFRTSANFIAIAYLRMSKLKHLPASPFVPAGLSGFLCVRRLGDLALGHFLDCFRAPARPPEAPRLSHVLMVQPPHLPACAGSVNRSS